MTFLKILNHNKMQQGVYQQFTNKTVKQVFKELKTSDKGLSEKEAHLRLQQNGKNEAAKVRNAGWRIFLRQFQSPFIYLLFAASSLVLFLRQYLDAVLIFAILLITGILNFVQEYRSEKTLEKLKSYISTQAKVKRSNQIIAIKKLDLVIGDLVLLEAGNLAPADLRIIDAKNLLIDESILTGESQAVVKTEKTITAKFPEVYQAKNIIFAGSKISSGKVWGLVVACGQTSEIGRIAQKTKTIQRQSTFQDYISHLSRFLIKVVAITLIAVFLANLIIKQGQIGVWQLMLFTVALAISILPEALPVVATITLTKGALLLAKKGVVIKRLSALEDLGNIDILCTDKTGTITQNQLSLDQIFAADKNQFLFFVLAGTGICHQKDHQNNYNFDEAFWRAIDSKAKSKLKKTELLWEIPFDPERRLSSVLIKKNQERYLVVKGAPEEVLKFSRYSTVGTRRTCPGLRSGGVFPNKNNLMPTAKTLTARQRRQIKQQFQSAGQDGKRIFAVGIKKITNHQNHYEHHLERGLNFLGFASLSDPLKLTTRQAIETAQELGVEVKILTGDSQEVAASVAQKIDLISSRDQVITGQQLSRLQPKDFEKIIEQKNVFARVNPVQKYQIIEALQKKHSVGFLGEGINDAPALKLVNVAIVVDSGEDVAKEAADIILLKKDLRVVIEAIAQGRKTFSNITKYIKTTLIGNFGNFYSLAAISLIIVFLPMLPVQILLANFLTDLPLMAVALDSVDASELKRPRHYNLRNLAFLAIFLGLLSSVFDFIFFGFFRNLAPIDLRTLWFVESVFSELILIISIRTRLVFFKAAPPHKILLVLLLSAAGIALFLPFSPWAGTLHFQAPLWHHLGIVALILGSYFVINEMVKLWYYRKHNYNS